MAYTPLDWIIDALSEKEFYSPTAPKYVVNDVKNKSKAIWKTYDDTFKYASEKINIIDNSDNIYYIIQMFDHTNKEKLWLSLNKKTKDYFFKVK